jgi:hypothetical protein
MKIIYHIAICILCSFFIGVPFARAQETSRDYRHYAKVPSYFYNSSIMTWAGQNKIDRLALASPEAALARAKELKRLGINLVVYSGRHFRLSYQNEWPAIAQEARIVVQACHAEGIRVIEHHEFVIPAYNSYPLMLSHLDWMQRDINTGEPLRWFYPENPQFLTFYEKYLADLQHTANFDGYMLDELQLDSSYAGGDRAAFKKATGDDMPYWTGDGAKNDSPTYHAWLRWRTGVPMRAKVALLTSLRKIRPDISFVTYSSDYAQSITATTGTDLALDVSQFCSFMGLENLNVESINAWRPTLRTLKLRQSFGDYYDVPTWALMREMRTHEGIYAGWALCQLGKTSIWYGGGIETVDDYNSLARYNGWKESMPQQYARTLTDTGFLLSNQTRQASSASSFYYNDFAGWCDLLLEGNKQFDTLLDGDLALPDRLHKYKVLILASSVCLSKTQIDHLENWVRNGGTVIVTRTTSLYDENAKQRPQFGLSDAMNVRYEKYDSSARQIEGIVNGKPIAFTARGGMCQVNLIDPARSHILAKSTIGEPAIIETPYGNGRFIYVAADIGTGNYETRFMAGRKYSMNEDSGAAAAVQTLYQYAHKTPPPIQLEFPKGVVGVAYQEQGGPQDGTVYIQILNVSGKNVKIGDAAQHDSPGSVTFPPVTQPLRIILQAEPKGDAMTQSPMQQKVLSVSPQKTQGGVVLTIPGSELHDYLQVRLPAAPLADQAPPPVPIAP